MGRPLTRLLPAALLAVALSLSAAGDALAQAAAPAARRDLAPTGALRMGLIYVDVAVASRDPATGELWGVGVDLGRELARRLGVPFAPVGYATSRELLDGLRAGQVDAVIVGVDPTRALEFAFAPPHLADDMTYIVRADSPIRTAADADRPGVRIAAVAGSAFYLTLERELRSAELVGQFTRPEAYPPLEAGTVQAIGFSRSTLLVDAAQRPGLRVVEGRFGVQEHAVMLPQGRPAGLAFVTQVVEQAKASGLVQQAIVGAGVQGVQVPPPARGLRLPATGAPSVPASPRAPAAAAAILLLGAGLAATGHRRRTRRVRPVAASG